jgi:SAM-dependent methyltransferase
MISQNDFHDLTQNFYLKRNKLVYIDDHENESFAKQVGWQSYESQNHGFEVATNLTNISWDSVNSVLDIGCGYGELVRYLREVKEFEGTYTGVDILEHFIDRATQIHGDDERNTFICANILSCSNLLSSYDIIISMGTLSVNYDYPYPCGEETDYFADKLIELSCSLAKLSAVVYFINEENTTFMERAVAENMAFYNSKDIYNMIIKRGEKGFKNLTMESYPNPQNPKTIAKIYYI